MHRNDILRAEDAVVSRLCLFPITKMRTYGYTISVFNQLTSFRNIDDIYTWAEY